MTWMTAGMNLEAPPMQPFSDPRFHHKNGRVFVVLDGGQFHGSPAERVAEVVDWFDGAGFDIGRFYTIKMVSSGKIRHNMHATNFSKHPLEQFFSHNSVLRDPDRKTPDPPGLPGEVADDEDYSQYLGDENEDPRPDCKDEVLDPSLDEMGNFLSLVDPDDEELYLLDEDYEDPNDLQDLEEWDDTED